MDYAGPLWTGKIFDKSFVDQMITENTKRALRNSGKITKLLNLTREEADAPITYYVLDKLSQKLSLPAPAMTTFFQALRSGGFSGVATHFNSRGVRTNAPALAMQETMKKTATPT
jgi:tRNA (guanine26-N2/guanine27-N2)-dimethyltransferase